MTNLLLMALAMTPFVASAYETDMTVTFAATMTAVAVAAGLALVPVLRRLNAGGTK